MAEEDGASAGCVVFFLDKRARGGKKEIDNDEDFRHTEDAVPSKRLPSPTDAELAILRVLWDCGPSSVRQILARMREGKKDVGYTTVLKLVQIMTGKGLVVRDETQRPQIYRPSVARAATQGQMLKDLVQRAFSGSEKEVVLRLLSGKACPAEELERVERLLDKLEGWRR